MEYIATKLEIEKRDIPKVLIYTKAISTVSYLSTLALCYKYKPFGRFMKTPTGIKYNKYVLYKYPVFHNKITNMKNNILTKIDNSKYIKQTSLKIGLNPSRFAKAFMENFMFYKLTLPFSIPLYMCLSVFIVKSI